MKVKITDIDDYCNQPKGTFKKFLEENQDDMELIPVTNYPKKQVECDNCGYVSDLTKFIPLKLSCCKCCGSTRIRLYKQKNK